MAAPNSIEPLDDLVPRLAAAWSSDLDLKDASGNYPRVFIVSLVGASPSLVLNLQNGQTRTFDTTNSPIAAGWELPPLKVKSIDSTTANVTAVLVRY